MNAHAFVGDTRPSQEIRHVRRRMVVRGLVQGVGFRPYIYRLAQSFGLSGAVRNTSVGAVIEVEGEFDAIDLFEHALPRQGPPLMRILSVEVTEVPLQNDRAFLILESNSAGTAMAWVPSDIAVCADCLRESRDRGDRRYEYPFTNCTNCGPRYSIIHDLPYDRAQTTMASFAMCAACEAEYHDPANRRFHAQPNACSACGPHLWLADSHSEPNGKVSARLILEEAIGTLLAGKIVGWKGLGGYQLACDATNDDAVRELRRRKHRNQKAFAVMVGDTDTARALCEVSPEEADLLASAEKPIVLLQRKQAGISAIPDSIAPGMTTLGVMLPYTPMHDLLFRCLAEMGGPGRALVMTSGNLSEEPIVIDEVDAGQKLGAVVDLFVHHDRPIHTRVDDSVARVVEGVPMLLRRARGYAPSAILLSDPEQGKEILACGAQQKSTLCLVKAGSAMLSQHLGDLENWETLEFFRETMERMQRLFQATPAIIAHDLHPTYLSAQFAKKLAAETGATLVGVQHHHAHIASCMAEHGLTGKVLGVAWDGTGYGTDGAVWGGEFLIAGYESCTRFAHLRYVPMAGGDAAVREPWRMARSYLLDAFDGDVKEAASLDNIVPRGIGSMQSVPESSVRMLDTLLRKRVHTIETSSCGRLFDAVASLLDLYQVVSFEGQAAMALEVIADRTAEAYGFAIGHTGDAAAGQVEGRDLHVPDLDVPDLHVRDADVRDVDVRDVDVRTMVRQIVDDLQHGEPKSRIAARFHNTLVNVVTKACRDMRDASGLDRVCLSGGCFQNVRLLTGCLRALRNAGFQVFFQQQVPANDGGIALGQAAIAHALTKGSV